jgi:hypothetical protein
MIEYRVGNDLDIDEVIDLYHTSTLDEPRPVDNPARCCTELSSYRLQPSSPSVVAETW